MSAFLGRHATCSMWPNEETGRMTISRHGSECTSPNEHEEPSSSSSPAPDDLRELVNGMVEERTNNASAWPGLIDDILGLVLASVITERQHCLDDIEAVRTSLDDIDYDDEAERDAAKEALDEAVDAIESRASRARVCTANPRSKP